MAEQYSDLGFTPATPTAAGNPHADLGFEVTPDPAAVRAFDAANNRIRVPEAGDIPTYMAQPALQRFGHSLWNSTIGGAIEGVKTALGTDELEHIADLVKQGRHGVAAMQLGNYLFTGPGTRLGRRVVENSVDQFNRGVEDVVQGNWGGAATHAIGQVPIVGPMISQPIEQFRSGDVAGGMGTLTGEAASILGPKLLEGRAARVPIVLAFKNSLNPVEQAAQRWLESKGVDTSLGLQTGSKPIRNLEGSVQNDIGGAGYALARKAQTRADTLNLADQMMQQLSPGGPITRSQAGEGALNQFKTDIRMRDLEADQAYGNAYKVENDPANLRSVPKEVETAQGWQTVRDPNGNPAYEDMPLPVDMFTIQVALKPVAERYARTLSDTDARASLGLKTMREIINGPRHKPLSQAEQDLGLLKQASKTEKGLRELRTESQGLAANSVRLLQQEINSTMANARGGQQGLAELQAGRLATAKKWDLYDTARKFGKPNIEELEPVAVANKLLSGEDLQAGFLRKIQQMAPAEMPKIGRAYLEGLLDRATREGDIGHMTQVLNQWDKLGNQSKQAFFGAAAPEFEQLFVNLKRLAEEANPSRTGYMQNINRMKHAVFSLGGGLLGAHGGGTEGALLGVAAGEVAHVIGNAALARLLYSPKFTSLLRRGIELQLSGNRAGAAVIAGQLIRLIGTDAQPAPFNAPPKTRPPISSFDK